MTRRKPENIDHEHPSAASTGYRPDLITEADRQGLTTGMAVRETLKEEPTIQEMLEDAEQLAFTALGDKGIESPAEFLKQKGIFE